MNTTISLLPRHKRIIKKLKEKDPDFNLSQKVRDYLDELDQNIEKNNIHLSEDKTVEF
jgi:hypothetical protein